MIGGNTIMAIGNDTATVISNAMISIILYDGDENVIWEEPRIINYLLDYAPSCIKEIKHIHDAFKAGAIGYIREATLNLAGAEICLKQAFKALDAADFKQMVVCTVIESYVQLFPRLSVAYTEASQWYLQSKKGGGIDAYRAQIAFGLYERNWNSVVENCKKAIEIEPGDAELYIYSLMAKFHITDELQLSNLTTDLYSEELFKKALFYANEDKKEQLTSYANIVHEKLELAKKKRREQQLVEDELRRQEAIRKAEEQARLAAEAEERRQKEITEENNRKKAKFLSVFPKQIVSPYKYYVAIRDGHQVFISNDKTVYAQGSEFKDGQQGVQRWKNVSQVAVGSHHTVGLKDFSGFIGTDGVTRIGGGTVISCGSNKMGQREVAKWKNIWAIACGDQFTVALDNVGKVYVAGKSFKKIDCYKNWPKISKIFCGPDYFIGLDENGIPHLASLQSQKPDLTNISSVVWAACAHKHIAFLKEDGSVLAVGENDVGQCRVSDWRYIVSIAAGRFFTAAYDVDGKEYFAGSQSACSPKRTVKYSECPYSEVYASYDNIFWMVSKEGKR